MLPLLCNLHKLIVTAELVPFMLDSKELYQKKNMMVMMMITMTMTVIDTMMVMMMIIESPKAYIDPSASSKLGQTLTLADP